MQIKGARCAVTCIAAALILHYSCRCSRLSYFFFYFTVGKSLKDLGQVLGCLTFQFGFPSAILTVVSLIWFMRSFSLAPFKSHFYICFVWEWMYLPELKKKKKKKKASQNVLFFFFFYCELRQNLRKFSSYFKKMYLDVFDLWMNFWFFYLRKLHTFILIIFLWKTDVILNYWPRRCVQKFKEWKENVWNHHRGHWS